jgi:hypothetical protein
MPDLLSELDSSYISTLSDILQTPEPTKTAALPKFTQNDILFWLSFIKITTCMQHDGELTEAEIEHWMREALEQARNAVRCDEVPVGCVFIRCKEGRYQQ